MQRNEHRLFTASASPLTPDDVFTNTLNQLISQLGHQLKAFHLSECLREIANYYVTGMQRHTPPSSLSSIHIMCLSLLEKAGVIESANENVAKNLLALYKAVPCLTHDKGVYNDQLREQRLDGYRYDTQKIGPTAYFKTAIKQHVAELHEKYSDDEIRTILGNILTHLSKTRFIHHLAEKHAPNATQLLTDAADSFKADKVTLGYR